MSCPSQTELFRLLEGELKERDAERLRTHTHGCASCQARITEQKTLIARVAAPFAAQTTDASVAQVMARLEQPVQPARASPVWRWQPLAFAALAAAVLGVVWVAERPADSLSERAFASRGSRQPLALHQQVGVQLYEVGDPVRKLERDAKVSSQSSFVAGYTNLDTAGSVFLTVFAVDSRGEVHWLYPGHSEAAQDPSSLSLAPAKAPVLMPEAVTLERPAPGPLRILSIVSRQPLKVSAVESLPPGQLKEEALRARWPDASITATRVDVTE